MGPYRYHRLFTCVHNLFSMFEKYQQNKSILLRDPASHNYISLAGDFLLEIVSSNHQVF